MKPCVLVALPKDARTWVVDALRGTFELRLCEHARRARAFVMAGCFQAVVTVPDFFDAGSYDGPPIVMLRERAEPSALIADVEMAVAASYAEERARIATALEMTELSYREFADLSRYRATRQYLLALVHAHQGSVTEAARAASLERESLHRLLRRHGVNADDFRDRT